MPAKKAKAAAKKAKAPAARAPKHHRKDGSLESVGRIVDGARVGPWRYYHTDGRTLKAAGKYDAEGRFTGLWTWYAANGKVRQRGRFKEGKQDGPWTRYYGGTTQRCDAGRYANGKRTGAWTFYDRAGNVRRTRTYR